MAAAEWFVPASSAKVLTTAAALRQVEELALDTAIAGTGQPPVLAEARLLAGGDPTLTRTDLTALARQLDARGVRRIRDLVVEDRVWNEAAIAPTWDWEDVYADYGTAVTGMILDANAVTLTVLPTRPGEAVRWRWSDAIAAEQWQVVNRATTAAPGTPYAIEIRPVLGAPVLEIVGQIAADGGDDRWGLALRDPRQYAGAAMAAALAEVGIRVDRVRVTRDPGTGTPLARVSGPTPSELVVLANRDSNNLVAEVLLRALATPAQTGLENLRDRLRELGVAPDSYALVDGSGLSRQNWVSPQALVGTLQGMAAAPEADLFRNSLAIAGETGTLSRRLPDLDLQAKSGTLSGVSALSGYLHPPEHPPLAFAIVLNHGAGAPSEQRAAIDDIVRLLDRLHPCSALVQGDRPTR